MAIIYGEYSNGWKPVGSSIYKKARAYLNYGIEESELKYTITVNECGVNINSTVESSPGTCALYFNGVLAQTGEVQTIYKEGWTFPSTIGINGIDIYKTDEPQEVTVNYIIHWEKNWNDTEVELKISVPAIQKPQFSEKVAYRTSATPSTSEYNPVVNNMATDGFVRIKYENNSGHTITATAKFGSGNNINCYVDNNYIYAYSASDTSGLCSLESQTSVVLTISYSKTGSISETITERTYIAPQLPAIDIYKATGTSASNFNIGFGTAAAESFTTNGKFDCALDTNFTGALKHNGIDIGGIDSIVEQGTNEEGWIYRKWNSGFKECWICKNLGSLTFTSATGGGYKSNAYTATFPVEFTNKPIVNVGTSSVNFSGANAKDITTTGCIINVMRHFSQNTLVREIHVYVCGF